MREVDGKGKMIGSWKGTETGRRYRLRAREGEREIEG